MRRVDDISFHAVDQRQDVEYLDIEPCLQRLLVRRQVRAFQKQRPHHSVGAQAVEQPENLVFGARPVQRR